MNDFFHIHERRQLGGAICFSLRLAAELNRILFDSIALLDVLMLMQRRWNNRPLEQANQCCYWNTHTIGHSMCTRRAFFHSTRKTIDRLIVAFAAPFIDFDKWLHFMHSDRKPIGFKACIASNVIFERQHNADQRHQKKQVLLASEHGERMHSSAEHNGRWHINLNSIRVPHNSGDSELFDDVLYLVAASNVPSPFS